MCYDMEYGWDFLRLIKQQKMSRPQAAIANATSLAEVERLKGMLQSGQIPGREIRQGNTLGITNDTLIACEFL